MSILMNVKEVCNFLGVSHTTIYSMVKNNEIPYLKLRGKIMFNRELIEDWTKAQSKYKEVN